MEQASVISPNQPTSHSNRNAERHDEINIDWDGLQNELVNATAVLKASLDAPSNQTNVDLWRSLNDSIVHAVYFLFHGLPLQTEPRSDEAPLPCIIWPSVFLARLHLVDNLFYSFEKLEHHLPKNVRPVVILITDSLPFSSTRDEFELFPGEILNYENYDDHSDRFLRVWSSLCKTNEENIGTIQLFTLVPQSAEKLSSTVDAILESNTFGKISCPALVVLNTSCDSYITSDFKGLRKICDDHSAYLCVEGPGLSMLAQANVPSDPASCLNEADLLIADLGSWFGFCGCAAVSIQRRRELPSNETEVYFPHLLPPEIVLKELNYTLIPIMSLWTVISGISTQSLRQYIDKVTVLAETFVHLLDDSTNLEAIYEGIACVVRISYVLPRDDRIMSRENARKHVSAVNNAIFMGLEEKAAELNVIYGEGAQGTFFHFSPARLISRGSKLPDVSAIEDFVKELQDAADRYEACRVGAPAFLSSVMKCNNLQMVEEVECSHDQLLSFGCFRVVPANIRETWGLSEKNREQVYKLTSLLANELSYGPRSDFSYYKRCIVMKKKEAAPKDQYIGLTSDMSKSGSTELSNVGGLSIPFSFYLHSEMGEEVPDFISVEPKNPGSAMDVVREARLAADFVIKSTESVMKADGYDGLQFNFPFTGNTLDNTRIEKENEGQSSTNRGENSRQDEIQYQNICNSSDDDYYSAEGDNDRRNTLHGNTKLSGKQNNIEGTSIKQPNFDRVPGPECDLGEGNWEVQIGDQSRQNTQLEDNVGTSTPTQPHWQESNHSNERRNLTYERVSRSEEPERDEFREFIGIGDYGAVELDVEDSNFSDETPDSDESQSIRAFDTEDSLSFESQWTHPSDRIEGLDPSSSPSDNTSNTTIPWYAFWRRRKPVEKMVSKTSLCRSWIENNFNEDFTTKGSACNTEMQAENAQHEGNNTDSAQQNNSQEHEESGMGQTESATTRSSQKSSSTEESVGADTSGDYSNEEVNETPDSLGGDVSSSQQNSNNEGNVSSDAQNNNPISKTSSFMGWFKNNANGERNSSGSNNRSSALQSERTENNSVLVDSERLRSSDSGKNDSQLRESSHSAEEPLNSVDSESESDESNNSSSSQRRDQPTNGGFLSRWFRILTEENMIPCDVTQTGQLAQHTYFDDPNLLACHSVMKPPTKSKKTKTVQERRDSDKENMDHSSASSSLENSQTETLRSADLSESRETESSQIESGTTPEQNDNQQMRDDLESIAKRLLSMIEEMKKSSRTLQPAQHLAPRASVEYSVSNSQATKLESISSMKNPETSQGSQQSRTMTGVSGERGSSNILRRPRGFWTRLFGTNRDLSDQSQGQLTHHSVSEGMNSSYSHNVGKTSVTSATSGGAQGPQKHISKAQTESTHKDDVETIVNLLRQYISKLSEHLEVQDQNEQESQLSSSKSSIENSNTSTVESVDSTYSQLGSTAKTQNESDGNIEEVEEQSTSKDLDPAATNILSLAEEKRESSDTEQNGHHSTTKSSLTSDLHDNDISSTMTEAEDVDSSQHSGQTETYSRKHIGNDLALVANWLKTNDVQNNSESSGDQGNTSGSSSSLEGTSVQSNTESDTVNSNETNVERREAENLENLEFISKWLQSYIEEKQKKTQMEARNLQQHSTMSCAEVASSSSLNQETRQGSKQSVTTEIINNEVQQSGRSGLLSWIRGTRNTRNSNATQTNEQSTQRSFFRPFRSRYANDAAQSSRSNSLQQEKPCMWKQAQQTQSNEPVIASESTTLAHNSSDTYGHQVSEGSNKGEASRKRFVQSVGGKSVSNNPSVERNGETHSSSPDGSWNNNVKEQKASGEHQQESESVDNNLGGGESARSDRRNDSSESSGTGPIHLRGHQSSGFSSSVPSLSSPSQSNERQSTVKSSVSGGQSGSNEGELTGSASRDEGQGQDDATNSANDSRTSVESRDQSREEDPISQGEPENRTGEGISDELPRNRCYGNMMGRAGVVQAVQRRITIRRVPRRTLRRIFFSSPENPDGDSRRSRSNASTGTDEGYSGSSSESASTYDSCWAEDSSEESTGSSEVSRRNAGRNSKTRRSGRV